MSAGTKGSFKMAVFPSDKFGCGFYRLIMPATLLRNMGHDVDILYDYAEGFRFKENPLYPGKRPQLQKYDLYHFQRVTTPAGLEAIKEASKLGVVLMDMDDDLFNLYPGHPSAWYFRKGKECTKCHNLKITPEETKCPNCGHTVLEYQDRLQCTVDAFQYIDCLTVTTESLKQKYGHLAKRVEIVPNYIDMRAFMALNDKSDEDYVSVGWAGSFTHAMDLSELLGGIEVITEFENVYFMSVGDGGTKDKFGPTLQDRLIELQPVNILRYPQLLKNFDIGLAPILDNSFNNSKSALKTLEYGACKIPVIASDVGPYKDYVQHGKTGFLVKKRKEWRKYLRMLLENPELRKEMGQAGYEQARTMDINDRIVDREALYQELIENKKGRVLSVR